MAKKANLASALDDVMPPPIAAPAAGRERSTPVIPSREGTVLVGAHLPARYGKAMKLLSAETGRPQRELFEEALKLLFVKEGAKV
jgi:hypothetical protein